MLTYQCFNCDKILEYNNQTDEFECECSFHIKKNSWIKYVEYRKNDAKPERKISQMLADRYTEVNEIPETLVCACLGAPPCTALSCSMVWDYIISKNIIFEAVEEYLKNNKQYREGL